MQFDRLKPKQMKLTLIFARSSLIESRTKEAMKQKTLHGWLECFPFNTHTHTHTFPNTHTLFRKHTLTHTHTNTQTHFPKHMHTLSQTHFLKHTHFPKHTHTLSQTHATFEILYLTKLPLSSHLRCSNSKSK